MPYFSPATGVFYEDAYPGTKPADVVLVTDAKFQQIIDLRAQGKIITGAGNGEPVASDPPPPPPAALKASKLRAVNKAAEAAVSTITDSYPQFEIDTFDAQEHEARAWLLNNATVTPTLSIIAAGRGITIADLTARVIAKADLFRPFVASIIAKRQALEDQLSAINLAGGTAAAQIAAIDETEITTLAAQLLGS